MAKMFWGVTIENDKRYTQTVEASFHLSMAALHPTPPAGLDLTKSSTVSLWVQHDKAEFLLCTLEYGVLYQQPLDCNFTEGEELTFFLNGQGVIHLTGYLIEDMSMADSIEEPMMSESEEDSEESEDVPALVDAKELAKGAKKRTKEMKWGSKKKCKVEETKSDDSSDEESDSDDDDFEDEEESSSDEDIPEDSDESDDEEITRKKAKKDKSAVAKNNTSHSIKQPEQTKSVKEQKLSENLKKKAKKILSNSNQSADVEDSLEKILLDAAISSEKKKKKKKKKQTKSSEMSNDPVPNKKQESSSQIEESKKSLNRVLSSGLAIEDTQVGQGSEARIGRQVHVYYSGKLAKTGKMFDRCINGKPFRFTLGKGEVISGWEKGLVGMRVGGKRTLTVPAKLGYGNQKIGPIPPNSSLIFDIELKAVS